MKTMFDFGGRADSRNFRDSSLKRKGRHISVRETP